MKRGVKNRYLNQFPLDREYLQSGCPELTEKPMCPLNGKVALEEREKDAVPNGPECVQMEAPSPPCRLPFP